MVKAAFCGWCKKMAPDFQAAADMLSDKVVFASIRADDGTEDEKEIAKNIQQYIPDFKGYPHLALYKNGVRIMDQPTGRSKDELVAFLRKYL